MNAGNIASDFYVEGPTALTRFIVVYDYCCLWQGLPSGVVMKDKKYA